MFIFLGKETCFERIVTRFGRKCSYVAVGDGQDEETAAKALNIPFWRISGHNDAIKMYEALSMDFLWCAFVMVCFTYYIMIAWMGQELKKTSLSNS